MLWWALLLGLIALFIGAIVGLGQLVMRTQSGADPATALNLIPAVPADLEERLLWLPDQPQSAQQREMELNTRELITGAYLRAWAQWGISLELGQPYGLTTYYSGPALAGVTRNVTETVASGWRIRQSNLHHELALHYYSDDGSVVSFTDFNVQLVQQYLPRDKTAHTNIDSNIGNTVLQSDHRYDVVMLLEDGNWRVYQWRRLGNALPSVDGLWQQATTVERAGERPGAAIATIEQGRLVVNGKPFAVAGVNYYPQSSPWTAFWPTYDPQQTTIDLQRIRALGLNTVRIFLSYSDFGGTVVTAERRGQLADFLSRAARAELQVIVTLFDHHTDHHPATWAADARHLATLIPEFASHPALLAWDLKNEPDRVYGYSSEPLVDAWLRYVARHVRWHDPNHLITIGWSTPEAATALSDIVDFVAYHYFDEPAAYPARVARLQQLVGSKPLLLEEFTFSTWNVPYFPGHSELEQQNYYAAMLNGHEAIETLGYLAWTLYDFDQVPLAEFRYPWQRAAQANMGLFRRDGRAKLAAALVAPQATRNLTPLPNWYFLTKPFWITTISLILLLLLLLFLLLGWRWRRRARHSWQR